MHDLLFCIPYRNHAPLCSYYSPFRPYSEIYFNAPMYLVPLGKGSLYDKFSVLLFCHTTMADTAVHLAPYQLRHWLAGLPLTCPSELRAGWTKSPDCSERQKATHGGKEKAGIKRRRRRRRRQNFGPTSTCGRDSHGNRGDLGKGETNEPNCRS